MARDLSLYCEELSASGEENLDASDERLLAVIDLFDKRKYANVGDKVEELAEAGIFDIRPLSYLLFVTFHEEGIGALETIFDVVVTTFEKNRAVIGPQKNQPSFYAKRLSWLWTTINDHLAYFRNEAGADWDRMRAGVTDDSLAATLEKGKLVHTALADPAYEKTAMAFAGLMSTLRTLAEELAVASRAAQQAAPQVTDEDDDAGAQEDDASPEGRESAPSVPVVKSSANSSKTNTVTLEVSHQFLQLLSKLKAFETLIERGDVLKAAIVVEDIQTAIEHFDPRDYFPGLFSRFSELLAQNADTVSEFIDNRDSFAWKSLAQFYKVDLAKFVRGDGDAGSRRR